MNPSNQRAALDSRRALYFHAGRHRPVASEHGRSTVTHKK